MKKNTIIIALLVSTILIFASCTSFTVENLAYGKFEGRSLGDFEVTLTSFELLGMAAGPHLLGGKEWKGTKMVNDAIQAEIDRLGGTAAINIEIEEKIEAVQFILNYVTSYIYAPETIVIKGTVIK